MTTEQNELPGTDNPGFEVPGEIPAEPILTQEESAQFVEAVRIGQYTRVVDIFGHRVEIQSLTVDDELRVGVLTKPFQETQAFAKAYKAAVAAAALVRINDEPFFTPITKSDEDSVVERKFEKLKSYYAAFVDAIYKAVLEMESEAGPLLEKLGKSRG